MAVNCVQLKQSLAHLQNQLNVLTNQKANEQLKSEKPKKSKSKKNKDKIHQESTAQEIPKEQNNELKEMTPEVTEVPMDENSISIIEDAGDIVNQQETKEFAVNALLEEKNSIVDVVNIVEDSASQQKILNSNSAIEENVTSVVKDVVEEIATQQETTEPIANDAIDQSDMPELLLIPEQKNINKLFLQENALDNLIQAMNITNVSICELPDDTVEESSTADKKTEKVEVGHVDEVKPNADAKTELVS